MSYDLLLEKIKNRQLKVGVIGAGQMGQGIAQATALGGFFVMVYDTFLNNLNKASENLKKSPLKFHQKLNKSVQDMEQSFENIQFVTDLCEFDQLDLIIEAVPENLELKNDLFQKLNDIIPDHTIVASNTSSISISTLAQNFKKPAQFLGIHFMNPVLLMPLIEVIRGNQTSQDAIDFAHTFCDAIHKTSIDCKDSPGFVVNSLLIPMINDAVFLVQNQVATAQDVDKAMKLGANHPMGPLELGDFIGLDTVLAIMNVLYDNFNHHPKYQPSELLIQMVAEGKLGKKSSQGFYSYK